MKTQIIFILFAAIVYSLANSVPRRFSQMEGQKVPLDSNANDDDDGEPTEEKTKSVEEIDDENVKEATGNCAEGWENFQDEVCFYGLKTKKGFFKGVNECGKLGANFTSIHSIDEFNFITKHWDLHRYWIGIIYGNDKFEDDTDVDQNVFSQFRKYVPWAWPEAPKGFICRAKPGDNVKVAVSHDSLESNEENQQIAEEGNAPRIVSIANGGGLDGDKHEKEEGNGLIGGSSIEESKNQ